MRIQVLVAAMHQKDASLLEKMNIQSDAIVGNQCQENRVEQFLWKDRKITYLSFAERGVGLNRNNALLRADGDVCLFADEDMRYCEDYPGLVERAFAAHPDADAIVFNLKTVGDTTRVERRINRDSKRVRWYNALNYGAARLAVKNSSVRRENLSFHRCFGGGTLYSCGEDTLFIVDMLKHGLKLYTWPETIAQVEQNTSTWFSGYNEKFLYDKGALFQAVSRKWAGLLCLQDLLRHPQMYRTAGLSFRKAWALMKQGRKGFAALKPYEAAK